jgi:aryl-alcohol dehydrogenase-like predicted oxidoreductase
MSDLRNESDTFDIGGDLTVHRLGFGAMRITGEGVLGEPDDVEAARDVVRRAVELGVDLIDTADSYGPGTSERLLREALHPYPDDLTVATKGGLLRTLDGDWLPHGDPDYLENALQCSLDRLGVGTIDLYQFHRPDPDTPFEESVHRLAELKDRGLIRHVGLSNVSVEQLETARDIVEIATVQNRYNVAFRDHEDVLAACEEYDVGFIPWYPLGGGDLGAKAETLAAVATNHDATPQQVALAWLLEHSDVLLPIPGTASVEHLEANVAAAGIELTDAERRRLAA